MPYLIIVTGLQPCTIPSDSHFPNESVRGGWVSIRTWSKTTNHLVPRKKTETNSKRRGDPQSFADKLSIYRITGRMQTRKGGMRDPEGCPSWVAKGSWLGGRINQEEDKVGISLHCRMVSPLPWLYLILWWVNFFFLIFPFNSEERESTQPLDNFYTKSQKKPGWCGIYLWWED